MIKPCSCCNLNLFLFIYIACIIRYRLIAVIGLGI